MERFVKGEIVVVPFPYSNLSNTKKRPAFVLATLKGDDIILCQITSQETKDNYSIQVNDLDFKSGSLNQPSNIRPNKIFTADKNIIERKIGFLKESKIKEIINKLIDILKT